MPPTPLTQQLTQRIQQHGPITYAEWMAAALYHPQHGYYRRGQPTVGPQGDFLTSPEVHPVFGAAVARLAQTVSESLGHPDPFRIVEVGPGSGALAESLLTALEAQLHTPISLTLVEADHTAAQTQRRRLANFRSPIEWRSDIADAPTDAHLVLANELLDAQPVHRLRFEHDAWTELLVGCAPNGAFRDCPAPLANPALSAPLQNLDPQDRQIVEISPARADLVAALANLLTDGLLLLFDYGYPRRELYDPPPPQRHPDDLPQPHTRRKPLRPPRRARHHLPHRPRPGARSGHRRRPDLAAAKQPVRLAGRPTPRPARLNRRPTNPPRRPTRPRSALRSRRTRPHHRHHRLPRRTVRPLRRTAGPDSAAIMSAPTVGDPLPNPTLHSPDGPIALHDLLGDGPLLILFYREDATPACTTQLCAFRDEFELLTELGASVVAISADDTQSQQRFRETQKFPFPLLSDPNLTAAQAFNVADPPHPPQPPRRLHLRPQRHHHPNHPLLPTHQPQPLPIHLPIPRHLTRPLSVIPAKAGISPAQPPKPRHKIPASRK